MKITDLPSGSGKFKATIGPSSFRKKLSSATRAGELRNLKDNKESILKAVKTHERAIRMGKFTRGRRINAWKMVKKNDPNLSKKDIRDIKKLFVHLSEGKKESAPEKKEIKIEKELDKDTAFAQERQKKAKESISRFNQARRGGEAGMKLKDGVGLRDENAGSTSAEFLKKRFLRKEEMLKNRMPRQRVEYTKERENRLEVSSLSRDLNKRFNPNNKQEDAEKKRTEKRGYEPFQNL